MTYIRPAFMLLIFSFLLVNPMRSQILSEDEFSSLILKIDCKVPILQGLGGHLTIRNVQTGDKFQSRGDNAWTAFVIIDDLPSGKYEVVEFEFDYQSATVVLRDTSFFNQIEIDDGKNFFMGSYRPEKIGTLFNFFMRVTKEDDDPSTKKILQKLKNKYSKGLSLEVDYSQSLFKSDSTDIDVGY